MLQAFRRIIRFGFTFVVVSLSVACAGGVTAKYTDNGVSPEAGFVTGASLTIDGGYAA